MAMEGKRWVPRPLTQSSLTSQNAKQLGEKGVLWKREKHIETKGEYGRERRGLPTRDRGIGWSRESQENLPLREIRFFGQKKLRYGRGKKGGEGP